MKIIRLYVVLFVLLVILSGCATTRGPSIVKTYDKVLDRSDIAIVRLTQKMSLTITACDGITVPRTVRYLLLQPGRHELIFSISGQTLISVYEMRNKKYLDAVGGHTYTLQSETGWFSVGDKWFPEVVDVTDNPNLHVTALPSDEGTVE